MTSGYFTLTKEMEIDYISIKSKVLHHVKAFVYIMHEDRKLGIPTIEYVRVCLEGYRTFGFSPKHIEEAVKKSMEVQDGNKNNWI